MILLLLIGYVAAYMIVLMMWIAFLCGVAISFMAYVVSYVVLYAWQAAKHRSTPEWRFTRKSFEPQLEKIHDSAAAFGVVTMVFLVFGFFVHAFTMSWTATFWTTGVLAGVTAFFAWDELSTKKGPPRDRPTFGEIRDKHST